MAGKLVHGVGVNDLKRSPKSDKQTLNDKAVQLLGG